MNLKFSPGATGSYLPNSIVFPEMKGNFTEWYRKCFQRPLFYLRDLAKKCFSNPFHETEIYVILTLALETLLTKHMWSASTQVRCCTCWIPGIKQWMGQTCSLNHGPHIHDCECQNLVSFLTSRSSTCPTWMTRPRRCRESSSLHPSPLAASSVLSLPCPSLKCLFLVICIQSDVKIHMYLTKILTGMKKVS